MTKISTEICQKFQALLPQECWSVDPDIIAPHLIEWRDKFHGSTPLILMPKTTKHVQDIIKLANATNTPIAIQGGNTGLVGGNTPSVTGQEEVLLSLKKMDIIKPPCPTSKTMRVGAGAILHSVQQMADNHDFIFPLSLASEGSCTIGGNLATNAGGIHVIKYGTMRALVAGIEAVMPDGRLYSNLSGLVKDNTGYDLQNLLIGAEGTLGVITQVRLKLFPKPKTVVTAWLSVNNSKQALDILTELQNDFSHELSAFEVISRQALDFVTTHMEQTDPLPPSPWSIILELTSTHNSSSLQQALSEKLTQMMDQGLINDAVIAQSNKQRQDLWRLRDSISEAQKYEGGSIKHDISLPLTTIPDFLEQAFDVCQKIVPNCRPSPFGHLGDGNLHYNVMQPVDMNKQSYLGHWQIMNEAIHDLVMTYGGSISAEHGIGTLKRDALAKRAPEKIALLKAIKKSLDPQNILNPNRLIAIK